MTTDMLLLFARLSGLFVLSPLLSGRGIPKSVCAGVAFACSLLLAPPLAAKFTVNITEPAAFTLQFAGETMVGYLIGFIFSLLFEAAAFAGQLVGVAMGFSATEILDSSATSSHPLMGRFFALVTLTLFFAFDLHHPLLRLVYDTFEVIPLAHYPFTKEAAATAVEGTALLFNHALSYAAYPLTLLLALMALFAAVSRFFPIFWVGFPLQLLVGFSAIAASIYLFAPLLEKNFYQLLALAKNLIVN